ncbi:hypothetical protein TNCV_5049351 [Trichonephila clavipes]|nr:hypothetical protein TNCV_5049351 [Trichonephila clavipes]
MVIELDPHVQSNDRSMPYPANHVQEHRDVPDNEPSFTHHHLPYFSRKLWIEQVQLFGHCLSTPNEKEFKSFAFERSNFRNSAVGCGLFSQKICLKFALIDGKLLQ